MSTGTQNNTSESAGPVVEITGMDEYGPLLGWHKHWANFRIGTKFYATPIAAQPDLTQQTLDDVMAGIPARDAEIAALRKEIEALQAAQVQPYSLDLDPAGIRALTADAISGALALGFQGVNPPPNNEHWLAPFWEIGRESAVQAQQPVSGADASRGSGVTWADAQKLAGMPAVDSALEVFCNGGTAENALALVRAVMIAQQDADKADAEPDMFWNADNPEQCQDSIINLLVEVQCDRTLRVGDIVEVQRAVSLPNVSIRITGVDGGDGDGDLEYEIINGVAINAARKEQT